MQSPVGKSRPERAMNDHPVYCTCADCADQFLRRRAAAETAQSQRWETTPRQPIPRRKVREASTLLWQLALFALAGAAVSVLAWWNLSGP